MGIRQSYIPMVPNTAIGFLALGGAVFVVATDQSRGRHGLTQDRFSAWGSASDGETGCGAGHVSWQVSGLFW